MRLPVRLLLTALLGSALTLAAAAAPTLEPLAEVSQETKTEIRLTLRAKGDKVRFRVVKVRKDGRDADLPHNAKLDADSGAFTWTPTPSQAGAYEFTFAARDADDQEATQVGKVTVRERSISAAPGKVGDLLRQWHAAGTAAGNTGDFYDNRDRDHSALNLAPYPQLDVVTYTDEERKERRDWAMQVVLRKAVTFGNSSTSAPVTFSGSNVRSYYAHPRGLGFLSEQYRGNNLYIYPAHHDHHPGRNGKPFYGDVLPANSPYLIASQGSSGSDQPFMHAVAKTLAAFRPEVKQKLVEHGLLMPTVQMIFRSANKHLQEPKEYLTGKAHPPVFEGSWVDELKMVQLAHAIELKTIPALVQLKVIEEDEPTPGRDAFDGPLTEKLGDSPSAIARVVRGGQQVRRMVVSAEDSFDVNRQPLTFHWVVLRGDKERIRIRPLNESGSKVELLVPYHERRPVEGAPLKIESNRVDIGAFVHNGTYYSAPGFVTFFYLDNEARWYDERGRLRERAYGFGETDLTITDWNALFDSLQADDNSLATRLLKKPFTPAELTVIHKAGAEYRTAAAALTAAQEKSKKANEARQKAADDVKKNIVPAAVLKEAEAQAQAAQKEVEAATRAAADVLGRKRDGLDLPVKDALERTLGRLKQDPNFFRDHREALAALEQAADPGRKARVRTARQRLIGYGVLVPDGAAFRLESIRPEGLTAFEQCLVERYHGELLSALLYPKFLTAASKINLVDQRLFTAKPWRDVYRYDAQGRPLGWTRYDGADQWDFNTAGEVVLERDEQGRPRKTRTVSYGIDDPTKNPFQSPWALKQTWGDEVRYYEFAGVDDVTGRVIRTETVADKR